MWRKLVWLNLYGCETVWHKLKNRQKMHFWCFWGVFELMSDSLTATKVETNQCPSHQSILLTQGPIHEIFMKKYWELTKPWKWLLFSFLVFGYWVVQKKFFLVFLYERNQGGSYEVAFIPAPWMVSSESLKGCIRTNMHTTVSGF